MADPGAALGHWCAVHGVPGAQLAITRGASSELHCYGVRSTETGVAVCEATRFQIGSVTKPMLAYVAFRLAEAGRLNLDAAPADYLPSLPRRAPLADPALSLRRLLNHSSGLPGDVFLDLGTDKKAGARLLERTVDLPSLHRIGDEASYCNFGYVALGEIISAVTGRHWADSFNAHVVQELRSATLDTWPDPEAPELAVGHISGRPAERRQLAHSNAAAGTTPVGTAADLAKFGTTILGALNGNGPLTSEHARQMTQMSAQLAPNERGLGFGQGFMVMSWSGQPIFGHDGLTIGQRAFLRVSPEQGWTAALVGNGGDLRGLYHDLFSELADTFQPAPPERLKPVGGAQLEADIIGRYDRPNASLLVEAYDDGLWLSILNHEPWAEFAYGAVEGPFPMHACGQHQWLIEKPGSTVPLMVSFGPGAAWHGMRRYNKSLLGAEP